MGLCSIAQLNDPPISSILLSLVEISIISNSSFFTSLMKKQKPVRGAPSGMPNGNSLIRGEDKARFPGLKGEGNNEQQFTP